MSGPDYTYAPQQAADTPEVSSSPGQSGGVKQPRGNAFQQGSLRSGRPASNTECQEKLRYAKMLGDVRRELSAVATEIARGRYEHARGKLEVGLQVGITVGAALIALMTGGGSLLATALLGAGAMVIGNVADSKLGPDAGKADLFGGDGPNVDLPAGFAGGVGEGLKKTKVPAWQGAGQIAKGVGTAGDILGIGLDAKDAMDEEREVDAKFDTSFSALKAHLQKMGFPGITDKTTPSELQDRITTSLLTEFPDAEQMAELDVLGACPTEVYQDYRGRENLQNQRSLEHDLDALNIFGIPRL